MNLIRNNKKEGYWEEISTLSYEKNIFYIEKGIYRDGEKEGEWIKIRNYNNILNICKISNYKNGILHGKETSFYLSSEKFLEQEWINGMPNGKISYYKDGTIYSKTIFENGKYLKFFLPAFTNKDLENVKIESACYNNYKGIECWSFCVSIFNKNSSFSWEDCNLSRNASEKEIKESICKYLLMDSDERKIKYPQPDKILCEIKEFTNKYVLE